MTARLLLLAIVAVGVAILSGCEKKDGLYSEEEHPWGAKLSKTGALAAALRAPEIRNSNLSKCNDPSISYYKPTREWVVFVKCRPDLIGMDFMIRVDDMTGKTTFVPGA